MFGAKSYTAKERQQRVDQRRLLILVHDISCQNPDRIVMVLPYEQYTLCTVRLLVLCHESIVEVVLRALQGGGGIAMHRPRSRS
jgi:hypothetical protein